MAKQRVQVEGPTSAAQLRAVASPVETYVRPAEQPAIKTDLEYFIGAISPAIKADAEIRKEQALKLQREAEKGIASKRAADVKLGLAKAQRLAAEDFLDNQDEYLAMSEEEVADRRARIMQPYFDMAQNSGDKLLMDAFQADSEMANLAFFTKVYDPAKRKRVFENDMDALTEELISVSQSDAILGDPELGATPTDKTLAKIDMIEDTINKYQAASGYSFRDMNDYIFGNVIAPRVAANGRDALYRWAEQKQLFNVSRYQKTVKTMNNELATRDKALLKAQDPVFFQQSITTGIDSFFTAIAEGKSANVGYLQVGNTVTLPSGATKTITENDVINSFEAYAASEQMSPALRLDFYKRTGFMPINEKNIINSGKSFFSTGDLENEANLKQAAGAFAVIEQMRMAGVDVPESVVDKDTMRRFKIAELWHRDAGMNIKDALIRSQDVDTTIKPSSKLRDSIQKKLGTIFITDHGETANNFNNISQIAEDVALIMQSGIADENAAIEKAIDIFEKDHVIHTASNGVVVSFKQLNTDVGTATDVTSTLDATAKAIGDNQQIKNIIANLYPLAEDAGVVITNLPGRPDIVRISVIDENGMLMGQLGTVSKTQLLNDPMLVKMLIANNIEYAKAAGVNVDGTTGDFEARTIASIDDEYISPEDLFLAQNVGFDLPTKEQLKENMQQTMGAVATPLQAAGEAIAPVLESLKSSLTNIFAQDKLDVPDLVSETVGTVVPELVQAEGDIAPFFEEEYNATKRKLSNIKAIKEAQRILSDMPDMIRDLGLDVRGLLSAGGKSKRGITQKEQAAIARSIIAVQNAGERQQDIETSQDLTDALAKAAESKGVTAQDVLEKVIQPMAFHESDGTMDPNLKQYGDGPARGVMQFEPPRFKTAVQRAKNYHEIIGQELPEWISSIDLSGDNKAIQKQITDLSANQQMALAVYDLLQHPKANIAKVINGDIGITEFWLDYWWAGDASDRYARSKAFNKSLAKFKKQ